MLSQTFKECVPNYVLFNFLDKICLKNNKYYTFSYDSFKKAQYYNYLNEFINLCFPYYHLSKRKYLEKKMTNKGLLTIIRQICNANDIYYNSQIIYNKSSYDIVYHIYLK